ncbi:hypothetical protein HRG84_19100 [Flavisolibacter sp. BT320]|nr:hypothetical protein [Flavisolibacter longurius]
MARLLQQFSFKPLLYRRLPRRISYVHYTFSVPIDGPLTAILLYRRLLLQPVTPDKRPGGKDISSITHEQG